MYKYIYIYIYIHIFIYIYIYIHTYYTQCISSGRHKIAKHVMTNGWLVNIPLDIAKYHWGTLHVYYYGCTYDSEM